MGRQVLRGLDDGLALGVERLVLGGLDRRARYQVAAIALAVRRVRPELTVDVDALGALGILGVTGPLDAGAAAELVVADTGVVARPSTAAFLPALERLLRGAPLHQRSTVLVAQVQAARIVQQNVE